MPPAGTQEAGRYAGLIPLSDGELKRLREKEIAIRRTTRLEQVRAKERAKSILKLRRYQQRVDEKNREHAKQKEDIWEAEQESRINGLETHLRSALKQFGAAHRSASTFNEDTLQAQSMAKRLAVKRAQDEAARHRIGLQVEQQLRSQTKVHRNRKHGARRRSVRATESSKEREKAHQFQKLQIETHTKAANCDAPPLGQLEPVIQESNSFVDTMGKRIIDFGKTRMHTIVVQHPTDSTSSCTETLDKPNSFEAANVARVLKEQNEKTDKSRARELELKQQKRGARAERKLQVNKDLSTLEAQLELLQRTTRTVAAKSVSWDTSGSVRKQQELNRAETEKVLEDVFEREFLKTETNLTKLRLRKIGFDSSTTAEPQPRSFAPVPQPNTPGSGSTDATGRIDEIHNERVPVEKIRHESSVSQDEASSSGAKHKNTQNTDVPETPHRNKALDRVFLNQSAPTPIAASSPFAAYANLPSSNFNDTGPTDNDVSKRQEEKDTQSVKLETPRKPTDLVSQLDSSLHKFIFSSDDEEEFVDRVVREVATPSQPKLEGSGIGSLNSSLAGLSGDDGDSVLVHEQSGSKTKFDLEALAASVNRALGEFGIQKPNEFQISRRSSIGPVTVDTLPPVERSNKLDFSESDNDSVNKDSFDQEGEHDDDVIVDDTWKTDPIFAKFVGEVEEALLNENSDDGSRAESISPSIASQTLKQSENPEQLDSVKDSGNLFEDPISEEMGDKQQDDNSEFEMSGSETNFTYHQLESRLNSALARLEATSSIVTTPTDDGLQNIGDDNVSVPSTSDISLDSIDAFDDQDFGQASLQDTTQKTIETTISRDTDATGSPLLSPRQYEFSDFATSDADQLADKLGVEESFLDLEHNELEAIHGHESAVSIVSTDVTSPVARQAMPSAHHRNIDSFKHSNDIEVSYQSEIESDNKQATVSHDELAGGDSADMLIDVGEASATSIAQAVNDIVGDDMVDDSPTRNALANAKELLDDVRRDVEGMIDPDTPLLSDEVSSNDSSQGSPKSSRILLSDANQALQRVRKLVGDVDFELSIATELGTTSSMQASSSHQSEQHSAEGVIKQSPSPVEEEHKVVQGHERSSVNMSSLEQLSIDDSPYSARERLMAMEDSFMESPTILSMKKTQEHLRASVESYSALGDFSVGSQEGYTGSSTATPFAEWSNDVVESESSPTIISLEHSSRDVRHVLASTAASVASDIVDSTESDHVGSNKSDDVDSFSRSDKVDTSSRGAGHRSETSDTIPHGGRVDQPETMRADLDKSLEQGDATEQLGAAEGLAVAPISHGLALEFTVTDTELDKAEKIRRSFQERSKQRAERAKQRAAATAAQQATQQAAKGARVKKSSERATSKSPKKNVPGLPPSALLERLAQGERAKLSKDDIRSTNERLYAKLPEVKAKAEQEQLRKSAEERRRRVQEMDERRRKQMQNRNRKQS